MRVKDVTAALLVILGVSAAEAPQSAVARSATPDAQQNAAATEPKSETLTLADIQDGGQWKPIGSYNPLVDSFVADTTPLSRLTVAVRRSLAKKYGLTVGALDTLITFLGRMEKSGYDRRLRPQLRTEALQLLKLSNRAPVVLAFAAGALGELEGRGCTSADVALLMEDSRNRDSDLWAIATNCSTSSSALAIAIDQAQNARPALLYLGLNWTTADPASRLASADMLLRPGFLAQVDAEHRDEIHAEIARTKLAKLLEAGLLRDAIVFGDSLPAQVRALALRDKHNGGSATIGGFAVQGTEYHDMTVIDYAAALAVAGRGAEARALLDGVAPAPARMRAGNCLNSGAKEDCGVGYVEQGRVPLGALVVDQLLDRPAADPYPLLEAAATGQSLGGGGVTEALCHLLSPQDEQHDCRDLRDSVAMVRGEQVDSPDGRDLWAAIERAGGQEFENAKARYALELASLGPVKSVPDWRRPSVDPASPPFQALPLPAAALATRPIASLGAKLFAPLPPGFTPVRIERAGNRVAAVSLSQRFDPDGEVSAGGYWIHLSTDGGKSWEPPLYTGLAEHFPYIVLTSSRLPMIAGDDIHLEVEESLIDTASITYPPVGTRVRRKRSGIYLDIPVAELRKDTDGDGITDITAHHLLLDGASKATTPFIVGKDNQCPAAPNAETTARVEILKKLFQIEAHALIEPVGGKKAVFGGWRSSSPTAKPPIFLLGNPDDYRCLNIDRMMIVYSDADQSRLRTFSPDFHLVELPPIHWNRDHSRGFLKWNVGWTGGTFRLIRQSSGWKLESIGQWIT